MPDFAQEVYAHLPPGKLGQLCELARILGNTVELKTTRDFLIAGSLSLTDSEYGSIQLFDNEQPSTITLERMQGVMDKETALQFDRLVVEWVTNNGTNLCSESLAKDSRFANAPRQLRMDPSVLASPIRYQGELIGVIILARPKENPFTSEEEMLLSIITELSSSNLYHLRHLQLAREENKKLKELLVREGSFQGLIGRSPSWQQVCATIKNVACSDARILILGESGTGKELCAKAIHELSPRSERPFVAVNCAAMPESLAESELFGYLKGSFTGALRDRKGLFGEADGGTLFLDEVGSASLQVQSSLLRAVQEGEIRPVGATTPRKINVRLICATSCDLDASVAAGSFRKDLFFRINVVKVSIPPLRERRQDILPLAGEFVKRYAKRHSRTANSISPEAMAVLSVYSWPGNVRELENAVEHSVLFTSPELKMVPVNALPAHILVAAGVKVPDPPDRQELGLHGMMEYYEKEIVRSALEACGWNQSRAARALKVPEKKIRDRMKKYDLFSPKESLTESRK